MARFTLTWMWEYYDYEVELTDAQVEALANELISFQQFANQDMLESENPEETLDIEIEKYIKGEDTLWIRPDNGDMHGFNDFISYDSIVALAIPEILPDMYKSMKAANPDLYHRIEKEIPQSCGVSSLDNVIDDVEKLAELCADGALIQFRHIPEEVAIRAREIVEKEWTSVN